MNSTRTHAGIAGITLLSLGAWFAPSPAAPSVGPTPIASLPFICTQPGTYCLTGNLTATAGSTGILVAVPNVVIDLGGFTLQGTGAATDGPGITSNVQNVSVRNGTIANWGSRGVDLKKYSKVDQVLVRDCLTEGIFVGGRSLVTNCQLDQNVGAGLWVGNNSVVTDCHIAGQGNSLGVHLHDGCTAERVHVNGCGRAIEANHQVTVTDTVVFYFTERGITAQDGAKIRNCVARSSNSAEYGIRVNEHAEVVGCTVEGDSDTGISTTHYSSVRNSTVTGSEVAGIGVGRFSQVDGCRVSGCNTVNDQEGGGIVTSGGSVVSDSIATDCQEAGVRLRGSDCRVEDCTSSDNWGTGIVLHGGSRATDNFVTLNSIYGIHVVGSRSLVQQNLVDENGDGIVVDGHSTLITGNRALDNVREDYVIPWGNSVGPINHSIGQIQGSKPQANF